MESATAHGFDQILALEKEQEERVRRETDAMAQALRATEQQLAAHEQAEEERMRAEAKKELMTFRDTDLSALLKEGEAATAKAVQALEADAQKRGPALVDSLVQRVLDPSFLSA